MADRGTHRSMDACLRLMGKILAGVSRISCSRRRDARSVDKRAGKAVGELHCEARLDLKGAVAYLWTNVLVFRNRSAGLCWIGFAAAFRAHRAAIDPRMPLRTVQRWLTRYQQFDLLQSSRVATTNFSAVQHRGIHANVDLIVLRRGAQDAWILG